MKNIRTFIIQKSDKSLLLVSDEPITDGTPCINYKTVGDMLPYDHDVDRPQDYCRILSGFSQPSAPIPNFPKLINGLSEKDQKDIGWIGEAHEWRLVRARMLEVMCEEHEGSITVKKLLL